MKTLLSALLVLAMVTPLCANTILFQEDFTGSTDDADLNGWNGWTAPAAKFYTASVVVDSGMSVKGAYGDTAWQYAGHALTHSPGPGETYTLSATFQDIPGFSTIMFLGLYDTETGKRLRVENNGGEIGIRDTDSQLKYAAAGSGTWDVKVDFTDTAWNGYYRSHGAATWTDLGGYSFSSPLANYDTVQIGSIGGYLTRGDTFVLTSDVPEPSTIVLLATGLIGLLAYAWRKRK